MPGLHSDRNQVDPELELDKIEKGTGLLDDAVGDQDDLDEERQNGGLLAQPEAVLSSPQPIAYLDGLRGLAALLVYFSHHTSWYLEPNNDLQNGYGWEDGNRFFATLPFVRVFFTGGSPAVSIFFGLSGYVLSRSSLRTLRDGGTPYRSLLSATVRRPFRLFLPPAAISMVLAIIMQTPMGPLLAWPPTHSNLFTELGSWFVELMKAINPFVEHAPFTSWFPYNPPVWTMSYEFKGSLLVFGMLAALSRVESHLRTSIFAATAILLLFLGQWAMACFMGGVVLSANDIEGYDEPIIRRVSERFKSGVFWASFITGWYLCSQVNGAHEPHRSFEIFGWYWLTMVTPDSYWKKEYWRFWNAVGAMLIIYALLRLRWLQLRFNSLKYLGKISFSFYLVHIPFLWVIGDRIYRFFGFVRPGSEFDSAFDNRFVVPDVGPRGLSTRFLFCQMLMLPLTMATAHVATVYVDEPSMRASRWISAKILRS